MAVLWLVIVGAFAAFNAVFWPAHMHQADRDPAQFLAYARKLDGLGETLPALVRLRQGIRQHHPPWPEPYELLQGWLRRAGAEDEALALEPVIAFYRALSTGDADRGKELRQAVRGVREQKAVARVDASTCDAVNQLAGDFSRALGLLDTVGPMSCEEQLALLRLSGPLRTDGRVGETGVRSPVDIVVQSGGGAGPRGVAHLFIRGREYAKRQRGLHAALVDAQSGQVFALGDFDIWDSAAEAARMTQFLREAPAGCIGVFAVRDDASANLTPALEAELLGFGLECQAVINYEPALLGLRYSFAAIGVKGASAGTALQAWSPEAFQGYPGHPVACGVIGGRGAGP